MIDIKIDKVERELIENYAIRDYLKKRKRILEKLLEESESEFQILIYKNKLHDVEMELTCNGISIDVWERSYKQNNK